MAVLKELETFLTGNYETLPRFFASRPGHPMQALLDELIQNPSRVPDVARRLESAAAPAVLTDFPASYDPAREAVLAICAPYLTPRGIGTRSITQAQLWHAFAQTPTPALLQNLRLSWQQAVETLVLYWPRLRAQFQDARERARAFHRLLGALRELDLDMPFPLDPAWDERELVDWKKQLRFPAHSASCTLDVPLFLRWAAYAGVREFWSAMDHCQAAPAHRVAILRHFPARRLLSFFLSVSGKRFERLGTIDEKMAVFQKICVDGKVDAEAWIRLDLPSQCQYDVLVKYVCTTLRALDIPDLPAAPPPSTTPQWTQTVADARRTVDAVLRALALVETLCETPPAASASAFPGLDVLGSPASSPEATAALRHRARVLWTALDPDGPPLPDTTDLRAHAAASICEADDDDTWQRHRRRGYYANRPSPFLRFFVEHVLRHHLPQRVHDALEVTVALLEQLTQWFYAPDLNPAIVATLREHEAVAKGMAASR